MIRRKRSAWLAWLCLFSVCFVSGVSAEDGHGTAARIEEAWQAADEAVRMNPGSSKAYVARARAWADKGAFDSALADLDQAIKIDPNATAFVGRGSTWWAKKEYDRAINDLTLALVLDPENVYALANRGRAAQARLKPCPHDVREIDWLCAVDRIVGALAPPVATAPAVAAGRPRSLRACDPSFAHLTGWTEPRATRKPKLPFRPSGEYP